LLDVDGVLAHFVQAALDAIQKVEFYDGDDIRFGRTFDPTIVTTWELHDSLPEPERSARDEVYRRMKARGGCLAIPVYDGAKEGFARLREIVDVTILTSPFNGSETWMHEREKWLEQHFGIHHRDIIHADKKFRVHGDVFIDDKPSHLHAWSDYWIGMGRDKTVRPVLWDSPRSADEIIGAGVFRVKSWDELIELLKREFAT